MNAVLKPKVAYALERISDVWSEIHPLLHKHWEEIAHFRDIPLSPDYARYKAAESQGTLRIFTVRNQGSLIGYALYFVTNHPHYSQVLHAFQDILFVAPEFRNGSHGLRLIRYADAYLRGEGVQVVVQHTKVRHDIGPLLERLGYELMDKLYVKRLDR